MLAAELIKQGKLAECVKALEAEIRQNPAEPKLRTFLFQVLCVLGQWDRAMTQLGVVGDMDPRALLMVQACRAAIACELIRERVFAGETTPLVLGEPEPWIGWMIQALAMDAQGKGDAAQELRDKAFEAAPATGGTLTAGSNEAPSTHTFEWIADADPRMGPILEAIVDGKYYWIPFHRIAQIRLDPPEDLRDAVWTPGQFVWTSGGAGVGFVPTRYPGSSREGVSDQLRLARGTNFDADPLGQRVLGTDAGEFDLMTVRSIVLNQKV